MHGVEPSDTWIPQSVSIVKTLQFIADHAAMPKGGKKVVVLNEP